MNTETRSNGGLPAPTGPCAVGRAAYCWHGRQTVSTREAGGARDLVVWIWYPAEPPPNATTAEYLPGGWAAAGEFLGFTGGAIRSHAIDDAVPASAPIRFPVLVFSPAGLPPLVLAAILEEVASHGYVVAGVNHTFESVVTVFPDGRVVPMDAELMRPVLGPLSGSPEDAFRARADIVNAKVADISFVVDRLEELAAQPAGSDRLAGRLDLARLGCFGHSMGGDAALEHCRLDPRSRAAANLDGANWSEVGRVGVEGPVLLVLADHSELQMPCQDQVRAGVYPSAAWCEAERTLMRAGWQTVYERARPAHGMLIAGTTHASFLDVPFLSFADESRVAGGMAAVKIDPHRAWRITCDYLLAFFAKHLLGDDAPLLDAPTPPYPEARLGAPKDLLPG
jgi:dienelactone hydrolase